MSGIIVLILRFLMALTLYCLLGWALILLWRDLRQQSLALSKRQIPRIQLTWQVDHQKQTREFVSPQIVIGRDPAIDCPVPDDTISAQHARLTYHHSQWWLEDLNSTNGTFLNQERLDIPTVIVSGDELRCGQISLFINICEE